MMNSFLKKEQKRQKEVRKMSSEKQRRLSYDIMHRKLQKVVARMVEEDDELTVRRVSEIAGVSTATAYKHGCLDMIRECLDKQDEKK